MQERNLFKRVAVTENMEARRPMGDSYNKPVGELWG